MAAITASLIAGQKWPVADVDKEELEPGRFLRQAA
jgi:hypothetical protein